MGDQTHIGSVQMSDRTRRWQGRFIASALSLGLVCSGPAWAADISVREIAEALFRAPPGVPVDLASRDLGFLDLSGLDFKAATLTGSNLYGADITAADLRHADLSRTVLDRATIVRADFSGANLTEALIRLPQSAGSPHFDKSAAPRFAGANLSHARLVARLDGADFRGANMEHANLAPYGDTTQNTLARRSVLIACDFSGARLSHADLSEAVLRFARFENAVLADANLAGADLTGADLSGADLTGADVTDTDFEGATLTGAHGLDEARGAALARNLDRARQEP